MEFNNIVLCFFSLLIILSVFNNLFPVLKEGATGSCDLENDPTYLAKVNAANIKAMKDEVGEAKKLREDIDILTELVEKNATSIQSMGEDLQEKSSELTGGFDPESGDIPDIDGLDS